MAKILPFKLPRVPVPKPEKVMDKPEARVNTKVKIKKEVQEDEQADR